MPRTEEANQQLRGAQRKRILEGAQKAFARKGTSATIADIAAAAGVSQGLAYRYFANKDAIYTELLEQAVVSSRAIIQRSIEMRGTPLERLNFLISSLLENNPRRLKLNHLIIQAFEDESTSSDLRQRLSTQSRSYQTVIRQLIVEGQAAGEIAPDNPDMLMIAIMACIRGLLRYSSRHQDQYDPQIPEAAIILRMLKS